MQQLRRPRQMGGRAWVQQAGVNMQLGDRETTESSKPNRRDMSPIPHTEIILTTRLAGVVVCDHTFLSHVRLHAAALARS